MLFLRNIVFTAFLVSISTLIGFAQGTLGGVVKDESGDVVPFVRIAIDSSAVNVMSDAVGVYTVELPAGEHFMEIDYPGFSIYKKSFSILDNQITTIDVELTTVGKELAIFVISAGKFEQELGEVTVSMDVIQPRIVQAKNTTSIDEILQQSSGVSIVDGEPQIRSGSGYSFGAGSRVQVLVDDLPMLSGDAGKPSWDFLPIENLSQIEVIKGASSVLYGSAALSGVINMRTAFPGEKPETQVTVFHGVFGSPEMDTSKYWAGNMMKTGANFLHKRKIGQLDLVVGGYFLGDDGHKGPIPDSLTGKIDNSYNPFTSDRFDSDTRGRVNANLRYRSKKITGLSIGLNTNVSMSNSVGAFIWDNSTTGLYKAYAGSATRTKQLLSTLDPYIIYNTPSGGKHSLRNRWQSLDNENDNNQGNFSDVYYTEYQYQQNWEFAGIKKLTTTMGVVNQTTTSRGELYLGGNESGINHSLNQALFFQADKKFKERLNVSGGVRLEQFVINGVKESKPVYRAGMNYKLFKGTYFRGSYGQGYRFPSIAEKFIVTSLGSINIYANPDLKSETSSNMEFGVKQMFKFGSWMGYLDVAVFEQKFENYIEFTFGQWVTPSITNLLGYGFRSVNTGKSQVRGMEASLMGEGKIKGVTLQFMGGYTYTNPISTTPNYVYARKTDINSTPVTYTNTSSDTTGYLLKYRMQHLVRADVQATWRKYSFGMSYRYNSNMRNIDDAFGFLERNFPSLFNPGIESWRANHKGGDFVIDLRASYKVNDQHKVALIMSNALNRTYAIRPLDIEEPRLTTIQYTLNF